MCIDRRTAHSHLALAAPQQTEREGQALIERECRGKEPCESRDIGTGQIGGRAERTEALHLRHLVGTHDDLILLELAF